VNQPTAPLGHRSRGNDLTQGDVGRGLFLLTAPMMLAVSSSIIVQMIEIGFIGQLALISWPRSRSPFRSP